MVRGLYTAYTGMINQQTRLDVITNNLANANTIGYKKEGATSQAFHDMLSIKVKDGSELYMNRGIGNESLGVKVGETYTDYGQGSFRVTGNTFDIAIEGEGFFNVAFRSKTTGEESVRYTRDGSFTLNNQNMLVTGDGDFVIGEGGNHIQIPAGADVVIDEYGIIYADGERVDKLAITDFENYDYLKKYGENMYIAVDGAATKASTARTRQGYLEMSNMNVISEMVEMITISRAYESNQKAIQTIDSTLEKSVNLGKV